MQRIINGNSDVVSMFPNLSAIAVKMNGVKAAA